MRACGSILTLQARCASPCLRAPQVLSSRVSRASASLAQGFGRLREDLAPLAHAAKGQGQQRKEHTAAQGLMHEEQQHGPDAGMRASEACVNGHAAMQPGPTPPAATHGIHAVGAQPVRRHLGAADMARWSEVDRVLARQLDMLSRLHYDLPPAAGAAADAAGLAAAAPAAAAEAGVQAGASGQAEALPPTKAA